jgi:hypothetical protein
MWLLAAHPSMQAHDMTIGFDELLSGWQALKTNDAVG